jgi:hypothetical protein
MRAGNPEVAARKPTARSCVANGRDILPDACIGSSPHGRRALATGLRRADLADAPLINPRGSNETLLRRLIQERAMERHPQNPQNRGF